MSSGEVARQGASGQPGDPTGHEEPDLDEMRTEDLEKPTVPMTYARLLLEAVEVHGVDRDDVLRATGLDPATLEDPTDRLSVLAFGRLAERALADADAPALGYEIALSSSLMSHGIIGFGMMTSSSLRDAIDLGIEFLHLRVPMLSAHLRVDGPVAAVSVVETVPLGALREVLFDLFLVKLVRIGQSLTENRLRPADVELWFDYPQPAHHAAFRHRLPPMRFEMGTNELRFPAALLDRRPGTADPTNARLVEEQCRAEEARLGLPVDVTAQVRAELQNRVDRYPALSEVAAALHTSSRTLKRRLHDHGTSFQVLLDDTRRAEAIELLTTTSQSVDQVARRLGYADARSFRRAFHVWTGTTPGAFRDAHRAH